MPWADVKFQGDSRQNQVNSQADQGRKIDEGNQLIDNLVNNLIGNDKNQGIVQASYRQVIGIPQALFRHCTGIVQATKTANF